MRIIGVKILFLVAVDFYKAKQQVLAAVQRGEPGGAVDITTAGGVAAASEAARGGIGVWGVLLVAVVGVVVVGGAVAAWRRLVSYMVSN